MEKRQFENKEFVLYSPDSLKYITDNLERILDSSLKQYKLLFDIDEFDKVQINFFDSVEKFRNFIYKLRGENKSLPSYAKGTYDKGMINAYIEPNIVMDSPLYYKKLYTASHELFHIMYQKLILEKENKERITWFDEGMAQFFSGEYSNKLNDNHFKDFINYVFARTKVIPDLNVLKHGKDFETENYSGYNLSLIAIKYLYDTIELEGLKLLMHDTDKIINIGKDIIYDAFTYYGLKSKMNILKEIYVKEDTIENKIIKGYEYLQSISKNKIK